MKSTFGAVLEEDASDCTSPIQVHVYKCMCTRACVHEQSYPCTCTWISTLIMTVVYNTLYLNMHCNVMSNTLLVVLIVPFVFVCPYWAFRTSCKKTKNKGCHVSGRYIVQCTSAMMYMYMQVPDRVRRFLLRYLIKGMGRARGVTLNASTCGSVAYSKLSHDSPTEIARVLFMYMIVLITERPTAFSTMSCT